MHLDEKVQQKTDYENRLRKMQRKKEEEMEELRQSLGIYKRQVGVLQAKANERARESIREEALRLDRSKEELVLERLAQFNSEQQAMGGILKEIRECQRGKAERVAERRDLTREVAGESVRRERQLRDKADSEFIRIQSQQMQKISLVLYSLLKRSIEQQVKTGGCRESLLAYLQ